MKRILFLFMLSSVVLCSLSAEGKDESFIKKVVSQDISINEKVQLIIDEMTMKEKIGFIRGAAFKLQGPVPRLGMEGILYEDSTMGVSRDGTGFPATLSVAASFDPDLMADMARAIAKEMKARGKRVLLAPGVNNYRMPTCGRNSEYTGEDPYLATEMALAFIDACQDEDVIATVKHFIANNQDLDRHTTSSDISERALREIYFPPFKAASAAGVAALMCTYNPTNGFPNSENRWLLTDILRDEWGFKGFVMSDWWCTYSTEGPFLAGLDLEMPAAMKFFHYKNVMNYYESGRIDQTEFKNILDEKVTRILTQYLRFKFYSTPMKDSSLEKNPAAHLELTQKLAEEGMVLLKNENDVLPIDQNKKQLVVITGPKRNSFNVSTVGACTVNSQRDGRGNGPLSFINPTVNPIKGFQPYMDDNTQIVRASVNSSKIESADKVIFLAGLGAFHEGEAHDRAWDLPKKIVSQIKKVAAANDNVIVVLNMGGGVETESWINDVEGYLYASFPGVRGDYALARVLFGDVNPSAKLPFTMAKKWEDFAPVAAQLKNVDKLVSWKRYDNYTKTPKLGKGKGHALGGDPSMLKSKNANVFENDINAYDKMDHMVYAEGIYTGYRHYDTLNIEPQFEFGYGLSYTQFDINNPRLSTATMSKEGTVTVSVDVTNSGDLYGAEVVQLYVHDVQSELDRPIKELKGFKKVYLKAGETQTVEITLDQGAFSYFNDVKGEWVTESGEFVLMIGNSSRNILFEENFKVN